MNPFSSAITDFHEGDGSASFVINRDDGFDQQVPVSVFFADSELPSLERCALGTCRGRVLDIGAAAGRHSLQLIQSGFDVTSLDILPEVEPILLDRGGECSHFRHF